MSSPDLPVEAGGGASTPQSRLERFTGAIAICGGLVTLAVALLVTASVLMRWLYSAPIDGDFEYVKMATAVAIFAYLPYTQARRGNIAVDTFTSWLPMPVRRLMDAFWDLAYAALMGYVAYCLVFGSLDAGAVRFEIVAGGRPSRRVQAGSQEARRGLEVEHRQGSQAKVDLAQG